MAAANGVRHVWFVQNGLLSTPAISAIIRERIRVDRFKAAGAGDFRSSWSALTTMLVFGLNSASYCTHSAATAASLATASSVGPRYAPPDPTFPKPRRGLGDGKTGYLYFLTPETNVTQYERPSSSAAPPKSSVPSSSVQVQQSSQGLQRGRSGPDLNDRYDRNGSDVSNEGGPRNHQSSKGGSYGSHNAPHGTHVAGNVSSSIRDNVL